MIVYRMSAAKEPRSASLRNDVAERFPGRTERTHPVDDSLRQPKSIFTIERQFALEGRSGRQCRGNRRVGFAGKAGEISQRWRLSPAAPISSPMRKIRITAQAFDAIAQALPLGSAAVEIERAEEGIVGVWLPRPLIAKLKTLRAPGESYSSVLLRIVAEAQAGQ